MLPRSPSHQYRARASRLGACARRTRAITTSCRRKPVWAVLPIRSDSHDPHRNARACHRRRSSGRNPAAHIAASRMGSCANMQHTRLSGPHMAGRGRSVVQSRARTRTRTCRRHTMGSRPFLCAHRRLVSVISSCPLEVARKRRIRALRPTSMRSRHEGGRMRRPGTSCAAT